MKITKEQLKQLIKEELGQVIEGMSWGETDLEGGPEADIQDAIGMLRGVDHLTGEVAENVTQMLEKRGVQAAKQAIDILEAEEDTTGNFYHVINRLYVALEKLNDDSGYVDF